VRFVACSRATPLLCPWRRPGPSPFAARTVGAHAHGASAPLPSSQRQPRLRSSQPRNPPPSLSTFSGAYAFIEFEDGRDAADAVRKEDGQSHLGGRIRVGAASWRKWGPRLPGAGDALAAGRHRRPPRARAPSWHLGAGVARLVCC
jgi:hypothetical protein